MPDIGYSMFKGAVPNPQPTQKVTNLSPHVDGGNAPGMGGSVANRTASADEKSILYMSAAIVLSALALLWLMGAFAFRGALL